MAEKDEKVFKNENFKAKNVNANAESKSEVNNDAIINQLKEQVASIANTAQRAIEQNKVLREIVKKFNELL